MAAINLLPIDYKIQRQAKRRRMQFLVIFFVLLLFVGGWFLCLVGKIHSYHKELTELQQQLLSLEPDLILLTKIQEKKELIYQRLQLCNQLGGEGLTWPTLLREVEAAAQGEIHLEQLYIDREGRILLQGHAEELAKISAFISFLELSPNLDNIDIDYLKIGKEGGWFFAIEGWCSEGT